MHIEDANRAAHLRREQRKMKKKVFAIITASLALVALLMVPATAASSGTGTFSSGKSRHWTGELSGYRGNMSGVMKGGSNGAVVELYAADLQPQRMVRSASIAAGASGNTGDYSSSYYPTYQGAMRATGTNYQSGYGTLNVYNY